MIEFPVAFIGACLVVGLFGLLVAESMELASTRAALDKARMRILEFQEDLADQDVQITMLRAEVKLAKANLESFRRRHHYLKLELERKEDMLHSPRPN